MKNPPNHVRLFAVPGAFILVASVIAAGTPVVVKQTEAVPVISTNWTSIGSFRRKDGGDYDVRCACVVTNYTVTVKGENQQWEIVVKSESGMTNMEDWLLVPIVTSGGFGPGSPNEPQHAHATYK